MNKSKAQTGNSRKMVSVKPQLPEAIENYFSSKEWKIFPFQREAWEAQLEGKSGLIHSPTGSGKTLAAWFGPVIQFLKAKEKPRTEFAPLTVLWITPLRALAEDTTRHLQETILTLNLPWSIGKRTSDTKASERARQSKRLPSVLITTPESLSLLLSYKDTSKQLKTISHVIVDEWHELLGSKRGVQLELCLARLKTISQQHNKANKPLQVWGMSATMGNLDQACDVLIGSDTDGAIIKGQVDKEISIESIIPNKLEQFPWSGHLGLKLLDQVIETVEQARSTLIFTNTRSQCEMWFEALLMARTDWIGKLALHHGSLSKDIRTQVEEGIRTGLMQCVVCTSSLDLGVDFSPVEQVVQIGSPKGVGRLLQRAGRSGHSPGAVSRVICVPTHAFELMEVAAARYAYSLGQIEQRQPLTLALDVLVQHMSTLALGGGFDADAAYHEIRTTHAFRDLDVQQWKWTLDFISKGGEALQHYPEYQRVKRKDGLYQLTDRRMARMHRMSIGTISSDGMIQVKMRKGGYLGLIEEYFITRLKKGDCFLYNGRVLELIRIKDMVVQVKPGSKKNRIVPRWLGGRLSLSNELAEHVRILLDGKIQTEQTEIKALQPILTIQSERSHLPSSKELLVEVTETREGTHLFIYPFAGRSVNAGISALIAYRLTQIAPATFSSSVNDYGFELLSKNAPKLEKDDISRLLSSDHALQDLLNSVNKSELAKRQFRDIARISGLIFQGYPGKKKSMRQVQSSSGLMYDVLKQHDSNNLLLQQSQQEVLEQQLEFKQLESTLKRLQSLNLFFIKTERLTPLAFPLWADRQRSQIISSEKWQARIERMLNSLNK